MAAGPAGPGRRQVRRLQTLTKASPAPTWTGPFLEGDPHAILEGMLIGGYAIGAREAFVYVRNEYPLAIDILEHAIEEAQQSRAAGRQHLRQRLVVPRHRKAGAGAYVCGEETALIESLEGHSGEPRTRPPLSRHQRAVGEADRGEQREDVGQREPRSSHEAPPGIPPWERSGPPARRSSRSKGR